MDGGNELRLEIRPSVQEILLSVAAVCDWF